LSVTARTIANVEFHHTTDETNEAARKIVAELERIGVRTVNGGGVGFPMEADRWGSKMWVVSHKPWLSLRVSGQPNRCAGIKRISFYLT